MIKTAKGLYMYRMIDSNRSTYKNMEKQVIPNKSMQIIL